MGKHVCKQNPFIMNELGLIWLTFDLWITLYIHCMINLVAMAITLLDFMYNSFVGKFARH